MQQCGRISEFSTNAAPKSLSALCVGEESFDLVSPYSKLREFVLVVTCRHLGFDLSQVFFADACELLRASLACRIELLP